MSDHHPDDALGQTAGGVIAQVVTVVLMLALAAVAGFVLLFPVLIGDF